MTHPRLAHCSIRSNMKYVKSRPTALMKMIQPRTPLTNVIHKSTSEYPARNGTAKRIIRDSPYYARYAPSHNSKPGWVGLAGGRRLRNTCVGGSHDGPKPRWAATRALLDPDCARDWRAQRTGAGVAVAVAVAVLNRMLDAGRPSSVLSSAIAA